MPFVQEKDSIVQITKTSCFASQFSNTEQKWVYNDEKMTYFEHVLYFSAIYKRPAFTTLK